MTIKVFVSGQSNALGRNAGGPDWSTIDPRVRVWNNVNPLGANGTAFTTPALARAGGTFENLDRNNFAVWLCDALTRLADDDVDMTIVARGASQIELWDPSEVTYPMLAECIAVWAATGQGPADVFVWHQGEGNVGDDYATYSGKFLALLSNLMAGGVIDANTVVLLGGLSQTGAANKIVFNREVLSPLANAITHGAFARSGTLPTNDGTHFTGDALYWFGLVSFINAYKAATSPKLYALVNEDGTPGVAASGTNSILDFDPVLAAMQYAISALQPGDEIEWAWLQDVPANLSAWELIPPSEVGVVSTNTEVVDWDATFGQRARFMGYTNGVSSGGPIAASGVGLLIPRASNQAAQLWIQSSSSAKRVFYRAGGASTWGGWFEAWTDANLTVTTFAKTLLDDADAAAMRATLGVAEATAGYRQKGAPIFITANGTYTPSAGTVAIMVEVIGGGGGGGGAIGNDGTPRCSSGGAAGGYARSFIESLAGSYSVTIGAAGTAGAADVAGAAGSGGTTSFGSISATGGAGGQASNSIATSVAATSSNGGAGSGGDLNLQGEGGGGSLKVSNDARLSGAGGSSKYGTGGRQRGATAASTGTAGVDASGYGAGGGGATSSNTVGQPGGAGAPGVVVVTEFVR